MNKEQQTIICEDCYRRQYCQFVLDVYYTGDKNDNTCILYKPSIEKRLKDYQNEHITTNQ